MRVKELINKLKELEAEHGNEEVIISVGSSHAFEISLG